MINSYNTQSLSCPKCKLKQDGYIPVIKMLCMKCRKEQDNESDKR